MTAVLHMPCCECGLPLTFPHPFCHQSVLDAPAKEASAR